MCIYEHIDIFVDKMVRLDKRLVLVLIHIVGLISMVCGFFVFMHLKQKSAKENTHTCIPDPIQNGEVPRGNRIGGPRLMRLQNGIRGYGCVNSLYPRVDNGDAQTTVFQEYMSNGGSLSRENGGYGPPGVGQILMRDGHVLNLWPSISYTNRTSGIIQTSRRSVGSDETELPQGRHDSDMNSVNDSNRTGYMLGDLNEDDIKLDLDQQTMRKGVKRDVLNATDTWFYYTGDKSRNALQLMVVKRGDFRFSIRTSTIKGCNRCNKIIAVTHIRRDPERIIIAYRESGVFKQKHFVRKGGETSFTDIGVPSLNRWKQYSLRDVYIGGRSLVRIQLEGHMGKSLVKGGVESSVMLVKDAEGKLERIDCNIPLDIPKTVKVRTLKITFQLQREERTWKILIPKHICTAINTHGSGDEACSADQMEKVEKVLKMLALPQSLHVVAHMLLIDDDTPEEAIVYLFVYDPDSTILFGIESVINVVAASGTTMYDMPITGTYPATVRIMSARNMYRTVIRPCHAGIMQEINTSSFVVSIRPCGTMSYLPFSMALVGVEMEGTLQGLVMPFLFGKSTINLQSEDIPGFVDVRKTTDDAIVIDVTYNVALPGKNCTDVVKLHFEVNNGGIMFITEQLSNVVVIEDAMLCDRTPVGGRKYCIVKQILVPSQDNTGMMYTFIYDAERRVLIATVHGYLNEGGNLILENENPLEVYDRPYVYVRPAVITVYGSGRVSLHEAYAGDIGVSVDETHVRASVRPEGAHDDVPLYVGSIECAGTQMVVPCLESDDGRTLLDKGKLPKVVTDDLDDHQTSVKVRFELYLADGAVKSILELEFLLTKHAIYLSNRYEHREHRPKWNVSSIPYPDSAIPHKGTHATKVKGGRVEIGKEPLVYVLAADVVYYGDTCSVYEFLYDTSTGHLWAIQTIHKLLPNHQGDWEEIGNYITYHNPLSGVRYVKTFLPARYVEEEVGPTW